MSGDAATDGEELLADLLAALDSDAETDLAGVLGVRASVAGLRPSGVAPSASDDVRAPGHLKVDDDGAALGMFSPLLGPAEAVTGTFSAPVGLSDRPAEAGSGGQSRAAVAAAPTSSAAVLLADDKALTDVAPRQKPAPSALTGNKTAQAKRKYDPNKARNERAKEIRDLRGEVADLTAQLGALQASTAKDANGRARSESSKPSAEHREPSIETMTPPPVWEAICRNQLERRIRAERENGKLKRTLDEHAKVVDSLQRSIQKASKAQKLGDGLDACAARRVYTLPSDSETDAVRFAQLLAEVDASRNELDGMFEANGIHTSDGGEPRRGAHMREGEHGRFVDMYSMDLLPFSVDATADVVWEFFRGPSKHRGPLYYKTATVMDSTESTVVEKFAIELFANKTRADFRVWQVLRRCVEADRVVVVWMGVMEPVELANKSFSSCGFREKGYVTCSRASIGANAEAPAFTRLRRCHRIVPYMTNGLGAALTTHDKREIGAVIDFILGLNSIGAHLEQFESELIKRSLRRQSDSHTQSNAV